MSHLSRFFFFLFFSFVGVISLCAQNFSFKSNGGYDVFQGSSFSTVYAGYSEAVFVGDFEDLFRGISIEYIKRGHHNESLFHGEFGVGLTYLFEQPNNFFFNKYREGTNFNVAGSTYTSVLSLSQLMGVNITGNILVASLGVKQDVEYATTYRDNTLSINVGLYGRLELKFGRTLIGCHLEYYSYYLNSVFNPLSPVDYLGYLQTSLCVGYAF